MKRQAAIPILFCTLSLLWNGCGSADTSVSTGSIIPSITDRLLDSTGNETDAAKLENVESLVNTIKSFV